MRFQTSSGVVLNRSNKAGYFNEHFCTHCVPIPSWSVAPLCYFGMGILVDACLLFLTQKSLMTTIFNKLIALANIRVIIYWIILLFTYNVTVTVLII